MVFFTLNIKVLSWSCIAEAMDDSGRPHRFEVVRFNIKAGNPPFGYEKGLFGE
jgi:hypothetical protein